MSIRTLDGAEAYSPQAGDTLSSICADQTANHQNPIKVKALINANFGPGADDWEIESALIERHGCKTLAKDPKDLAFPEGAEGELTIPKVLDGQPLETGKAHTIKLKTASMRPLSIGLEPATATALHFAPGRLGTVLLRPRFGGASKLAYSHAVLQSTGELLDDRARPVKVQGGKTGQEIYWDGRNKKADTSTIASGKLCTRRHGPYTVQVVYSATVATVTAARLVVQSFELAWPDDVASRRPADATAESREIKWKLESIPDLHEGHLRIHDAKGTVLYVQRLTEGDLADGEHSVTWDGTMLDGTTTLTEDQLPLSAQIRGHSRAGTAAPNAIAALQVNARPEEIADVTWVGAPAPTDIDPPYNHPDDDARRRSVRELSVRVRYAEPEDVVLKLFGERAGGGDPIELPLSMLGRTDAAVHCFGPLDPVEGRVRFQQDGREDLPALRLAFDTVRAADGSDVYPVGLARFKVTAEIAGRPASRRESLPLTRRPHVAVFANPDAEESQSRFWASGEHIRDRAAAAGHLAILDAGRNPAVPSGFEPGVTRGTIDAPVPLKFMRGASHFHYRGHGMMHTVNDQNPCSVCKWRANWGNLDQKRKERYLSKIIAPQVWDGTAGAWTSVKWSEVKRLSKRAEVTWLRLVLDESHADPDFDPRTTASNVRTRGDKVKGAFQKQSKVDAKKETQSVCGDLEALSDDWWEDAVYDAMGGDYVRLANNPPPGDGVWMERGDFLVDAPDVLSTAPPGTPVPPDQTIFVNTIQAKCEMGEDRTNRRGGFIFFEADDGSSDRNSGGKSLMCFDPGNLGADQVTPLDGDAPVPSALVHASGCLTASSDDLARAFLAKGTEVYIGNRVVAWGSWNRQMADALADKIYADGKSAEQAFNELKGEYVAKLRCALWKKDGTNVRYVDA